MAGRKLWSDQDVTSAAALLKSADASGGHERSEPARRAPRHYRRHQHAFYADPVDYDGIILKVNQLSNQVDNLRLADNDTDEAPMDQNSSELSSSIGEWRQNGQELAQFHGRLHHHPSPRHQRRAAAGTEPGHLPARKHPFAPAGGRAGHPASPERDLQAIAGNRVHRVRAYFDTTDPATKAFLEELDSLSQQSISMDVPDQLKSQPLLEK